MRVKELVHWLDSFDLSPTPWTAEPADWATGLNLLARLLHPTLERRIEEQQRKEGEEATEEEEEEETEGDDEGEEGRKKNKTAGKEDHQRLIKRPSQCHPSTQLALQEVLEMAERVLGVPQFAVIADLKHSTAENQLALFVSLCALHFALGPADIKPYRDFQFAFRIYFDMDSDGSTRECTACGQFVHLIERSVLAGQVWHRSCLKCALCGRQLYRGAFHFLSTSSAAFVRSVDDQPIRLECFEHRANAILFGDPKYRLALPPPSLPPPLPPPPPHSSMSISQHSFQQQQQIPPPQLDKRASLASMVASSCSLPISSPPPRPPPPKKIVPAQTASPKSGAAEQQQIGKEEKQNGQKAADERTRKEEKAEEEEEEEEESIEKKIASAAAARHDAPVPMPRMSLMMKQTGAESGNKTATEKTSWEVLEYPEELNPFGSEDEEEAEGHNGKRGIVRKPSDMDMDGANPFETDTEEEGDEEEEKGRRRRSPGQDDGSSDIGSGCSSPLAGPKPTPMVQLVQPKQPENAEENARGEERQQHQQKELLQTVAVDQPADGHNMNMANPLVPMYVPPLGPLVFRVGQLAAAADKSLGLLPLPPPSGTSSSTLSSSIEAQQILHELDTKLRRLHSQLDQWEITGTRLEGQIIRELAQKDNQVWRKNGNKLVNEYAQLVEKRCIALAKEGMLTRRYMDIFLNFAHAELDKQMREEAAGTPPNAGGKMAQFNELLAQFLHIRNELTELERREKEAKTKMAEMAKAGEVKKEAKRKEKEEKQQVKKEKKTKKNEDEKEEGRRIASEAKTIGEEKKKEKAGGEATGGGGGGRLLKNTFKNLKKKL